MKIDVFVVLFAQRPHEDSLMSTDEGFNKALAFLKQSIIQDPAGQAWWV